MGSTSLRNPMGAKMYMKVFLLCHLRIATFESSVKDGNYSG